MTSLTSDDMHIGFFCEVGEEKGKIMIIADVTEPEFIQWIKENVGEGETIEVEPEWRKDGKKISPE